MRKNIFVGIFFFALLFSLTQVSSGQAQKTNAEAPVADKSDLEEKQNAAANDIYAQIELFSYALTTIQSEYVDVKTPQELIYGSLKGMLGSLDPHSQFLTPAD